jgi:hypothetical protein
MLDGLLAFLALYIVDEAGGSAAEGALAVAVWTGAGLVGGAGLIRLLRRVSGLAHLRQLVYYVRARFPSGELSQPVIPADRAEARISKLLRELEE